MQLERPRIDPLDPERTTGETKELLAQTERQGRVLNIFRTLAHHPKLLKRWTVFGNHILYKSSLPPRDREILILRTGWLCRSEYEWSQHSRIGREAGLSEEEIRRIAAGPEAPGWDPFDAALLRAADELHADSFLSDATWGRLAERYGTTQLMDLVFTVGQYHLVSMALNSFGVQLEEGATGFPKRASERSE